MIGDKRGAFTRPNWAVAVLSVIVIIVLISGLIYLGSLERAIEDSVEVFEESEPDFAQEVERSFVDGIGEGDNVLLRPGGSLEFRVPGEGYSLILDINRCANSELHDYREPFEFDGQVVEYNPLFQNVVIQNGQPRIVAKSTEERNEAFLERGVYRVSFSSEFRSFEESFLFGEVIELRRTEEPIRVGFSALCDGALLLARLQAPQ